jgi:hypothetical protein
VRMVRFSYIFYPVIIFVGAAAALVVVGGIMYKSNLCDDDATAKTDSYYGKDAEVSEEKKKKAYDMFYEACDSVPFIYHALAEYDKELVY